MKLAWSQKFVVSRSVYSGVLKDFQPCMIRTTCFSHGHGLYRKEPQLGFMFYLAFEEPSVLIWALAFAYIVIHLSDFVSFSNKFQSNWVIGLSVTLVLSGLMSLWPSWIMNSFLAIL